MKKIIFTFLVVALALSFKPEKVEARLYRCPQAGTRYCDDYWTLIGTGPGGVLIYQKNCTLIVAYGENCIPTADPEFKEVSP